jgi:hypothetical protein
MTLLMGTAAPDINTRGVHETAHADVPPTVQKLIISARWEVETVYLIAELIRGGTLPSQRNLDRLELACRRLNNAVKALGGDQEVAA